MIGKKQFGKRWNAEKFRWETGPFYFIDGKEVSQKEYEKAFPDKPVGVFGKETTWKQPVESYGAACHPKRIKDFEAYMARQGVPTDFTTLRGRPRFTSRAHQLAGLKALKLHNRDEVRG